MDDRQIAAEQEGKFRFYFVALIFTILGLSVQSAPELASFAPSFAELLAWVLLLISGLAALSYLEWMPTIRVGLVRLDDQREQIRKLEEAQHHGQQAIKNYADGTVAPVIERIAKNKEILETLTTIVKKNERRNEVVYLIAKWVFVAGIVSLGFARGYPLALQISNTIKPVPTATDSNT